VLAELLSGDSRPPVPADPAGLLELVAERRAELLACARHRGRLIYAERPAAFARRTRRYLEEGRDAAAAAAETQDDPAAESRDTPAADQAEVPCGYEIERKFLVAEVPAELGRFPADVIEQGYIVIEGSAEVRVRRRAGRTLLTVKSGAGGVRVEEEFEIDERRFASLWPLSDGRRVAKTRYRLPEDGDLTIELDVYAGALDGLVLAEVEFDSESASDAYTPPDWFGPEVTDDLRYANRALAVDGVPATSTDAGAPGEP
jgi:CYTH domain-containing protein